MPHSAISKKWLVETVDRADVEFQWCWAFLRGSREGFGTGEIVAFQVRLVKAFWRLDGAYRRLHAEEIRLVSRKSLYSSAWFPARMAKLKFYKGVIKEALGIGRSLGDGFAWIFYRNDPELLEEHANHDRQVLLPPGVGGIGERLVIERLQGYQGGILIYHALTSFLRLGDFSVYDPVKDRITSILELKSQLLPEGRVQLTLAGVTNDLDGPFHIAEPSTSEVEAIPLDARTRQRLDRQVRQMSGAFEKTHEKANAPRVELELQFHYEVLERLVRASRQRRMTFQTAGQGLLMGALRLRAGPTLGETLSRSRVGGIDAAVSSISDEASRIMSSELQDNCAFVGDLGGYEGGFPAMISGGNPLIWWPLEADELYDLIFGRVLVITVYNPARLWSMLRERGYTVEIDGSSRVTAIRKQFGATSIEAGNFGYFEKAVQHGLLDDKAAADMFDNWVQRAVELGGDGPAKIFLRPRLGGRRPRATS